MPKISKYLMVKNKLKKEKRKWGIRVFCLVGYTYMQMQHGSQQ